MLRPVFGSSFGWSVLFFAGVRQDNQLALISNLWQCLACHAVTWANSSNEDAFIDISSNSHILLRSTSGNDISLRPTPIHSSQSHALTHHEAWSCVMCKESTVRCVTHLNALIHTNRVHCRPELHSARCTSAQWLNTVFAKAINLCTYRNDS